MATARIRAEYPGSEVLALTSILDYASTLDLQPLLRVIVSELKCVVDYTGARIVVQKGNQFRIVFGRKLAMSQ